MKTTISQWGRSLALRIPSGIVKQAQIQVGQKIDITLEDGEIRLKTKPVTEAELLAQVTPENQHELVDWGESVGKEVW